MKVILTTKSEMSKLKQITDLLNTIFLGYNISVIEKKKNDKEKIVKKDRKAITKEQKETKKVTIEKTKKDTFNNSEKRKRQIEWLEDHYYSQSRNEEEIDKLVNHYARKGIFL